MIFDYVIVGGGSAGCVLANRLSADPSKQVALLEAGPDTPPEHISTEIYALSFLPHYFGEECYWTKLEAYVDPIGNHSVEEMMRSQKPRRYEQARIMGGGSTVNGQVAIRGLPSDYDEWDSLGARGWRWDDCLPYFRRLERDMDFDGPLHGKEGPIPIHRTFPPDWGAFSLAFRDSLAKKGIPYYDDCHGQFGDGCFPFPRNNILTHRVSTAMGYLDGATRLRKNLHILAKTALEQIEFDGKRAVAALVRREGQKERIEGREIIISAGALHSPGILDAGRHRPGRSAPGARDRRALGPAGRGGQSAGASARGHRHPSQARGTAAADDAQQFHAEHALLIGPSRLSRSGYEALRLQPLRLEQGGGPFRDHPIRTQQGLFQGLRPAARQESGVRAHRRLQPDVGPARSPPHHGCRALRRRRAPDPAGPRPRFFHLSRRLWRDDPEPDHPVAGATRSSPIWPPICWTSAASPASW